jgi:hypothetical protein
MNLLPELKLLTDNSVVRMHTKKFELEQHLFSFIQDLPMGDQP